MSDPQAFAERLRAAWELPTIDEALAAASPLLHPDVVLTQPLLRTRRGRAHFDRQMRELARIYRDLRVRVVGWEADGDVVWVTFEMTGTVGRQRLRMLSRDRFVLAGAVARERRVMMNTWALVRPVLAAPSAWPRAVGVFVRLLF